jgi:hypothetical protein
MSLAPCVLGSGSSGNCSVLRIDGWAVLIDAGFGPRAVARRLAGTGVTLDQVRAILLTHLDRDHFNPSWCATILRRGITLHVAERHVAHLHAAVAGHPSGPGPRPLRRAGLVRTFDGRPFALDLESPPHRAIVTPVHLAHDRAGTVGYRIGAGRSSLAYATDTGCVPDPLLRAMIDVDLLAIESNYDHDMQMGSARPAMLKRRITSGRGHLSNDQAFEAIRQALARSRRPPAHVVLLHLSRQCNCPRLVRRLYRAEPDIARRLRLTSQSAPTGWLRLPRIEVDGDASLPGEQLAMFE